MNNKKEVLSLILTSKILPLYYYADTTLSLNILKALYKSGIKVVEYTNRGEAAFDNFLQLKEAAKDMPGLKLGIGTIKSKKQAKMFIKAGADFIVCPSINKEVGKMVCKEGLLWIPGCMTATEIAEAENAGATFVKIFPAHLLGPAYIKALKDIFPSMKFMVTGGVTTDKDDLQKWFDSGVAAVGLGSQLISKELTSGQPFHELENTVASVLASIKLITL